MFFFSKIILKWWLCLYLVSQKYQNYYYKKSFFYNEHFLNIILYYYNFRYLVLVLAPAVPDWYILVKVYLLHGSSVHAIMVSKRRILIYWMHLITLKASLEPLSLIGIFWSWFNYMVLQFPVHIHGIIFSIWSILIYWSSELKLELELQS